MTVRELGDRLGCDELAGWLAFDREFNLPDGNFVAATVAQASFAAFAGKAVDASEFAPIFRRPRRPQTVADHRAILQGVRAAATKGRV